MNPSDGLSTGVILRQIFELLKAAHEGDVKVGVWIDIATRLSRIAGKKPAWTWRYVASVAAGTVEPSGRFVRAVELLTQVLDGRPVEMAGAEAVQVYAREGKVKPGSLILADSKNCADPGCLVSFVPVVPWQKYCPRHKKRKNF